MAASKRYPHLFEPLRVKGTTFRNRLFTAPTMHHTIQDEVPFPQESFVVSYAQAAKGGAAQVNCGGQPVLPGDDSPFHACFDISQPAGWRNFVHLSDAVHFYGAKASYELLNFGGEDELSPERLAAGPVFACSAHTRADGVRFEQMPVREMERQARRYAQLAECIRRCGFDTVLIHGGHGTLLQEFLSPRSNTRTDEFGGSLSNRARFPLMVLRAVREAVGDDLLIEYRISGSECVEGGFQVDECIEFLSMAQGYIDIAHISAGVVREPRLRAVTHPTGFLPEGCNAYLAAAVKASGRVRIPVLTVGGFRSPEACERVLAAGEADLVATARATIADPDFARKAARGRAEDIVPCIQCFRCLDEFKDTHRYICSVNPRAGQELLLSHLEPDRRAPRRIAVVGGGPAGMRAAVEAAERGCSVVLFEASGRLGGQLAALEGVSFKRGLVDYADYLRRRVRECEAIELRLNEAPDPAELAKAGFDEVVAAIGGEPAVPEALGADGPRVVWAARAFERPQIMGGRVAVVGSGEVACEAAVFAAGLGREVTLLARGEELARRAMRTYREELVGQIADAQVRVIHRAQVQAFEEAGAVCFRDAAGVERRLEVDTALYAVGMRPRADEAERYRACAPVFRAVGDCRRVGSVASATWDAYAAAASAAAGV